MTVDNRTSLYDDFPYHGTAVANTSPRHLALCSLWHGGPRPPLRRFRTIELGCGDGANLLALAFYHPESRFIGIDSSEGELWRAREGASRLRLRNTCFLLQDVRESPAAGVEPVDYIAAHGLYSWVPEDARDAILAFCRIRLTPSGLAYTSYNAQPGWATRRMVREMLLRASSVQQAPIGERAQRAIEVATQLLEDLPSREYAHAVLLADELERVRDGKPHYVFHEHLADVNDGFWLGEFVERARSHGLEYVADAQFCRWEGHVPEELKATLARRNLSALEREEAADLLGNRYFRASILCRADAPRTSVTHRQLLAGAHIATSLSAQSNGFDLREGAVERFNGGAEPEVTLDASITKAAVVQLAAQWPRGMLFRELYRCATELLTEHGFKVPTDAQSQLADELIVLFEAGQVELRMQEPEYHWEVPEYPKAHALARFEADCREVLTTPYHLPLAFEQEALELVRSLDGSLSQAELRHTFGEELVTQTLPMLGRWGLLER